MAKIETPLLRSRDYRSPLVMIPRIRKVAEQLLSAGRSMGGDPERLERWIYEYLAADEKFRKKLSAEVLVVYIKDLADNVRASSAATARKHRDEIAAASIQPTAMHRQPVAPVVQVPRHPMGSEVDADNDLFLSFLLNS